MKTKPFVVALAIIIAYTDIAATAQVIPTTPGKFKMKPFGETGASVGTNSTPKPPETTVRQITYIALTPPRQWRSTDGKSLLGKLIAFEETVVTTTTQASAAAAKQAAKNNAAPPTAPTASPTLVRDGKARLLVGSTPFEVPLDRLVEEDRRFVEDLQAAVKAKSAAK